MDCDSGVCDSWKGRLESYLDGEVSEQEMRAFDTHLRNCTSCAADVLTGVQMKRAVRVGGNRFAPSAEFRKQMQRGMEPRTTRSFDMRWMPAAVAAMIVVVGVITSAYLETRSGRDRVFSEIADLHVATLASSSPVDVISTDRHTVKPWFQGKIPFSFNLPELQNSDFSLVGGRMSYLDQSAGAQLIYDVRKHHVSVFVFSERSLPSSLNINLISPKKLPFDMETWSSGGLRYFVIGDANPGDIGTLAKMFKAAAS